MKTERDILKEKTMAQLETILNRSARIRPRRGKKMPSAGEKKRYALTLNVENFETFKTLLREFGLPKGYESLTIDMFIQGLNENVQPVLQKMRERGKTPTPADWFKIVGGIVEKLEE